MELATCIDLRILNLQWEKHQGETLHPGPVHLSGKSITPPRYSSAWLGEDPEHMQLGRTSLSPEEKERHERPTSACIVKEQELLFPGVK